MDHLGIHVYWLYVFTDKTAMVFFKILINSATFVKTMTKNKKKNPCKEIGFKVAKPEIKAVSWVHAYHAVSMLHMIVCPLFIIQVFLIPLVPITAATIWCFNIW